MNYELIMLRQFQRMRKLSKCLSKEAKALAVISYGYEFSCNGTFRQIEQISQRMHTCSECYSFCRAAYDGLSKLCVSDRALLVLVYIKERAIKDVAVRYKTSVSTVYRRLFQARTNFRKQLESLGYDEQWFYDSFSHFDFVTARNSA